jgi:predicted restriction endonuclease
VLLTVAIERLYDLNVGITPLEEGAPHEKPHKPLLLLAAFDLIDEGLATPDRIPWCQELRERFTDRFQLVKKHNDQNNPDLPFRYLAGDGFWQAFEADGKTTSAAKSGCRTSATSLPASPTASSISSLSRKTAA